MTLFSEISFQALNRNTVFVLGSDGNLWYTPGPFGQVPNSRRSQVDGNVIGFQAVDANNVFVLGSDGNLWYTPGPFGQVPNQRRIQVDGNVVGFDALDSSTVFVLGSDGNLWYTPGPFGQIPSPNRIQVDGNVKRIIKPGKYIFRLENFRITNTRSRHNDTNYVVFSIKIGDQQPLNRNKSMGDVNNGIHDVGLEFGPVLIDDPNTEVVLNYIIVNHGHSGDNVEGALNSASDELLKPENIGKIMQAGSEGGLWGLIAAGAFVGVVEIVKILTGADCDGPVAADQISVSGALLYDWAGILGLHSDTRYYPGIDSAVGCGSNSKYYVTWSVRKVG